MAISTSLAKFSALQPTPCSSRSEGADGSLGAGLSAGDRDNGPRGHGLWRGGHLANFPGVAHFDMDATAKSVHVGRVPVKAAGTSDTTVRVRLGVPTAAAGPEMTSYLHFYAPHCYIGAANGENH